MSSEEFNLIGYVIVFLVMVVGFVIYHSSSRLSNCGSCGKYLTMQQNRYWYKVDGKDIPFCTKCHNKRTKIGR